MSPSWTKTLVNPYSIPAKVTLPDGSTCTVPAYGLLRLELPVRPAGGPLLMTPGANR